MLLCPLPEELGPMPVRVKLWELVPRLTMAEAGHAAADKRMMLDSSDFMLDQAKRSVIVTSSRAGPQTWKVG
jgi:CO dehydrogenase/acetyl-CoA synthase delta subunit